MRNNYSIRFLIACTIVLPLSTFSQYHILVTSNTIPDSCIFYKGVKNSIRVEGPQNLQVRSSQSKLVAGEIRGEYTIEPKRYGFDTLIVFNGKKAVFTKVFRVDSFPPIKVILGNLRDTVASKQLIIANAIMKFYLPGFIMKHDIYIVRFTAEFLSKAGENWPPRTSNRARLSDEQISTIQKLRPGDRIVFREIVCNTPSGFPRTIPDQFYLEIG